MKIEPARPDDYPAMQALLREHRLPDAGLREHLETALVIRNGSRLVGMAALEMYDRSALLRSVAVTGTHRGTGLGRALTSAALDRARQRGVHTIYLLTETAESFFSRLGFRPIDRTSVADPVRESVEFTTACPASAVCLVLELTRPT